MGDVNDGGGFPKAAFLIGDCDDVPTPRAFRPRGF